jgi:hypothetical protein
MWEAITLFLALPLLFVVGQFYCRLASWSVLAAAGVYKTLKDHDGQSPSPSESLP